MATKKAATAKTSSSLVFTNWDIREASKQLALKVDPVVKSNKKFMDGDHWQNNDGYIGPRPAENQAGSEDVMAMVQKGFISRNVIREVCRRHKNGVVGIEPKWGFTTRVQPKSTPGKTVTTTTPQDDTANNAIKEIEDPVTEWWDLRHAHQAFKDAAEMALWGRRGVIRLYIPVGLLPGGGLPNPTTLAAALRYIYVEALDAEQAGLVEDVDTKVQAAVMVTTDINNKEIGELVFPAEPFLDPENPPITMIKELGEGATGVPFPMDLGGRLTMFEIGRDLMITPQIQQAQKALNLDLTIMPRNIIQGGFLERIFLAAQMPGHWEKDDKGNNVKWIPEPFETGAATTNFVSGQEVEDAATGKTTTTTPQVQFRDPTDVQFAITAKNAHYSDILEECDQAHVLITGDATPSGKSRQEARADFEGSLRETQTPAQDAGRWLLETLVAMGEFLMGSPGKWTKTYRAEFECLIDSGPIDPTEETSTVALKDAGLISEETAMSRVRVLDVVAERLRRNAEPGANLVLRTAQFTALDAATKLPGVGFDGAAEFLGFTPAEITLLKKGALGPALAAPPGNPITVGGKPGAQPPPNNSNPFPPPANGGKPQPTPGARGRAPVPGVRNGGPVRQ